ncbi:LOW QUALITY PROTEIN: uncharacterized protein C19orf47-like [Ruditapes philippinarum]|uniref:LOW QUALITY PROTEIN: uncharacterized protein C19orf47-like n=1 Tax=Ruditapes philippinarum TaxID=129788 RepID=UPI00295C1003|nr:LOW QUALITY PROTEIN: uncharacterized protein C19orf47-like [Ruditapes philippinarum]
MSFWIKFFRKAGIPAGDAANYAVTFTDNRITRAMLLDLTKEYLNDMGISILGDVIAILKYAKTAHSQDARDRALRDTTIAEVITPKRSTPASRTIGHYLGSADRSASPSLTPSPKISRELSARLGSPTSESLPAPSTIKITTRNIPKEVVPVPKKNRRVFPEDEGHYTINLPQGTATKTKKILAQQRQQAELQRIRAEEEKKRVSSKQNSVFARLGKEKPQAVATPSSSQPTVTVTGLGNINIANSTAQQSIFARLGGKTTVKRAATSTVTFDDDEDEDADPIPLEYAGVLKESPSKKAKLEVAKKLKKTASKTLAKAKVAQPETAGVLASSVNQSSGSIKSRLGPKVAEASSTTQSPAPSVVKKSQKSTQGRLGSKGLDSITITVDTTSKVKAGSGSTSASGVFSRLGKPIS